MKSGLSKLKPDSRDWSLLHTYGALDYETSALPDSFSVYGNQPIPNQELPDTRFTPNLPPLPYGCTGETGAFESGLQDSQLYDPEDLYFYTPPGGQGGRDMRSMLSTLISRGPRLAGGNFGPKRTAYFNCYGAGKIDDYDAVRIALWINQYEKRGVYIGSYWYWGGSPSQVLPVPSFNISEASLHCYLATGWTPQGLEIIPWVGNEKFVMNREIFNALMGQPYTGCFTITKATSGTPVPIGYIAVIDHLVAFIRQLFQV